MTIFPFSFKPNCVVFFVFAAIFFAALALPCHANSANQTNLGYPINKWVVHVVNQMGASKTLVAHCKSKDDDLGIRDVLPGNEFNWRFKENFGGTTLFWCNIHNNHQHANFQVFWHEDETKSSWLHYRCNWKECFWVVKDGGIYIRNTPESRDELQHQWEPRW
ncbi:uncharacterized protein Pyn_22175 [Prunus yedoensis var. nudiflora]|uniref:S-protein homolog n=1 Tax=Prunus yedoensis var. nudiflora TaxID=2094558 RepID=A0A314XJ22_PRUYE|nr:uncharacterized protein Pyn_22175 [Prunus yedoensis var. nudiflora]